jgi:trigger factor
MSLNITTEPLEDCQLSVVVEVDAQRVDGQLRKAARKLARDYRIPGFRKGKAPYDIVVQFVGLQAIYNEFLDDLGKQVYVEAIEESEIEPYAQAALENIDFEPLVYKFVVPLEPEVDLGDYRALRVEEDAVEVDEEAITERLEAYRKEYAGWQDTERPSQYGDMMNMDVKSVIAADEGSDEEEIIVLEETDWDVTPDEESPMEPAGFDEALLGMTPGEEKEFSLTWPEDGQSIYAGKTANFSVNLNSNQSYEMPALNDEFAQLVGPEFETLDDLMTNIRETLDEQAQATAKNAYLDKALDALQSQTTMSYPPAVVEDQIDSMLGELQQQLRQFGIEDVAGYLQQTGQSIEQYRESVREQAIKFAERNLIISELWKLEQITVEDEDIEAKIIEIVGVPEEGEELNESNQSLADMLRESGRSILGAQILQEKSLDRLLAIVRGEEVPELSDKTESDETESDDEDAEVETALEEEALEKEVVEEAVEETTDED